MVHSLREDTPMQTTLSVSTQDAAKRLIFETFYADEDTQDIEAAYLFPSDTEIRLVYLDATARPSPDPQRFMPFYFGTDAESGIPYRSAVALIRPEEKNTLQPPDGWGTWSDAMRYEPVAVKGSK